MTDFELRSKVGTFGKAILDKVGPKIQKKWEAVKKQRDSRTAKKGKKTVPDMGRTVADLEQTFKNSPGLPPNSEDGTGDSDKPSSWESFYKSLDPTPFRKSIEDSLVDQGCPLRGTLLTLLAVAVMGTLIVGAPAGI